MNNSLKNLIRTAIIIVFCTSPAWSMLPPQGASTYPGGIAGYVPGTLIVNFSNALVLPQENISQTAAAAIKTGIASVDALNVKYNVYKMEKLFPGSKPPRDPRYADLTRYYVLEFPPEVDLDRMAADYASDLNVITAEKDALTTLDISTPNDPIYLANDQWPINYVIDYDLDMLDAWDYERGDSAVILGIIDTGILRTHIDLGGTSGGNFTNGNVWINWPEYNGTASVDDDTNGYVDDWWGWDFVTACSPPCWPGEDGSTQDNDPSDFNGHGTHVSGIAASMTNNSLGIAGIAGGWYAGQRGCKVMALRIGHSSNDGGVERGFVQSSRVGPAIEYARAKGVTAINMSFGIADLTSTKNAVTNALLDGVIVVHSAGNDNLNAPSVIDTMTVAGTTNEVISVASTDKGGGKSGFSNYGAWVDVSAPGGQVWATYSDHYTQTYAELSGTSMSSPHVVGLAGLMKSAFPDASGEEIYQWIVSTTKDIDAINPGYAGLLGSGLINAKNFFANVPIAKFGVTSPTRGHIPLAVSFADSSLGPVDSLFWEFGDGGTSADTNPSHVYTTAGVYTVKQYARSDTFFDIYNVASVERKDNLIYVIGDSVYFSEGHGGVGETKIPVKIYYRNAYPVKQLKIPVSFAGFGQLTCDSVNFTGSRVGYFLDKIVSIDNGGQTLLIDLFDHTPLPPGNGLLATAYFTIGGSASVGDTSALDTAIIGGTILEVNSTDPLAGSYDPKFINGFLAVEPWPRGDVDKSGALTLVDVIALVNHVFKGALPPDPIWLGDFNADGTLTLVDVIAMVNRIFKGI